MTLAKHALIAAVRCRFYTIIDWSRCCDLSNETLKRELEAVVGRIVKEVAPEMAPESREALKDEIAVEACEMDIADCIELGQRFMPEKRSLVDRLTALLTRVG